MLVFREKISIEILGVDKEKLGDYFYFLILTTKIANEEEIEY